MTCLGGHRAPATESGTAPGLLSHRLKVIACPAGQPLCPTTLPHPHCHHLPRFFPRGKAPGLSAGWGPKPGPTTHQWSTPALGAGHRQPEPWPGTHSRRVPPLCHLRWKSVVLSCQIHVVPPLLSCVTWTCSVEHLSGLGLALLSQSWARKIRQ